MLNADSKGNELGYSISVKDAGKPGLQLYQSSVYGNLAHDKLLTTLRLEDKKKKEHYLLSGTLSLRKIPVFVLCLNPDSILLNYQRWLCLQTTSFITIPPVFWSEI